MAHRNSRRYSKQAQINYRAKYFKAFKLFAWLTIILVALCVVALVVR